MKLQPIGRALLVQLKPQEKKTSLILTTRDDSEPKLATVLGVGDKVEAPIHEGDVVLLVPYCGAQIAGGTEESPYLIIAEKEILGILRE
jgi:co-chaperonin GroES (HSP10)